MPTASAQAAAIGFGPDWEDLSWSTTATPASGYLEVQFAQQWAGLQFGRTNGVLDPASVSTQIYGQSQLSVQCASSSSGNLDIEQITTARGGTRSEINLSSCPADTTRIAFEVVSTSFDTLFFASAQVCDANGRCSDLVADQSGPVSPPPPAGGFACEANAGVLTWTDDNANPYWTYRSTDGGSSFQWLGKTRGATTLTDRNPTAGAIYQVHYQGIPRVRCTTIAEPTGPTRPVFACQNSNGTLTWTDHDANPYWTYKSTDGGTSFQWLGKTRGATTLTDRNPTPGAIYQVHYQGIPRSVCTNGSTPPPPPPVNIAETHRQLIQANPTRNTAFDNNAFRNVPMDDLRVSDLTVNGDLYNMDLIDTTNGGFFRVQCQFSHFAYDDPIVFPGQANQTHLHMFFGNTQTNAYSTFDSLRNSGPSTCNGEDLNRTAYWIPALLDNTGHALIPSEIMVYYKNENFCSPYTNGPDGTCAKRPAIAFPDNLRMVVGNAMATEPQDTRSGGPGTQPLVSFACGVGYRVAFEDYSPLIPDCTGSGNGPFGPNGRTLEMKVAFPQCWNEAAGTYEPNGSHMAYSDGPYGLGFFGDRCPDSHPDTISSIMYRIFFDPDAYSLTDIHLSSDIRLDGQILPGGTTAHADWFGAWHPETMDLWIENCNNTLVDCETGLLGRDPLVSLVPRTESGVVSGYRAPPWELLEMCPTKSFDPNDPLRSVANCRTQ